MAIRAFILPLILLLSIDLPAKEKDVKMRIALVTVGEVEAVHELGHTYGLGHCENPLCVIFFSNSLIDMDRKGSEFCPKCKRYLNLQLPS